MAERALVVGGTGPTGPLVVRGLHERGYAVTILHTGQHEVDLGVPGVRHIHADPHFAESLQRGLAGETFEVAVAQYGRLKLVARALAGRAGRLVAVGSATALYAPAGDERWGPLGRPHIIPDTARVFRRDGARGGMDKLALRMVEAREALFAHHPDATYLGFPLNYGPRNPGASDWAVVRRLLDGRRAMVIADGGLKVEGRVYTVNAAHAVLLAVDTPDVAAGKHYVVADRHCFSMRQRIEFIAGHLGRELELVDLPWEHAWPCHPYWRHVRAHRLTDSSLIRRELGYRDSVPAAAGLAATVDWLVAQRPKPGGELERQLGDPFDYAAEDRLIRCWARAQKLLIRVRRELPPPAHQYRHPKRPGERWSAGAQDFGRRRDALT
jgi:nucleoside-diphosphate-sugar epimerase